MLVFAMPLLRRRNLLCYYDAGGRQRRSSSLLSMTFLLLLPPPSLVETHANHTRGHQREQNSSRGSLAIYPPTFSK